MTRGSSQRPRANMLGVTMPNGPGGINLVNEIPPQSQRSARDKIVVGNAYGSKKHNSNQKYPKMIEKRESDSKARNRVAWEPLQPTPKQTQSTTDDKTESGFDPDIFKGEPVKKFDGAFGPNLKSPLQ